MWGALGATRKEYYKEGEGGVGMYWIGYLVMPFVFQLPSQ